MQRKSSRPIKPPRLPSFYDAVYEVVREIPRGSVVAYGWVATWLGSPRAARAVGYALAACPPDVAPWQRVINSAGQISVGGDVSRPDRQRALLAKERVHIDGDDRIDLRRFGFKPSPRQLSRWGKRMHAIDSLRIGNRSEQNPSAPSAEEKIMADADTHKPPKAVQKSCERGLKLKEEGHGGKGLVDKTIRWAKHLAAGKETPVMECRRMSQWFSRHKVDKRPGWDNPPTPGFVAWELWGGDAGRKWAESIVKRADAAEGKEQSKTKPKKKAGKKKSKASKKKVTKKKAKSTGRKKSTKKKARAKR